MKIGLSLKIDVTKIDKSKLYVGEKGTYLDVTAFVDVTNADQYGNNGMVTQTISEEDRKAGQQGAILGNSKIFYNDSQQVPQQSVQNAQAVTQEATIVNNGGFDDFNDDIPF